MTNMGVVKMNHLGGCSRLRGSRKVIEELHKLLNPVVSKKISLNI